MNIMRDYWRFAVKPEIYFGNNAIQDAGKLIAKTGSRKILIVTDKVLGEAGIVEKVERSLHEEKIAFEVVDCGEPEPSVDAALKAIDYAKGKDVQGVVGLGGGSNMDLAKVVAIILTHGGELKDYYGESKVPGPLMPIIAVPTTAGTGSEMSYGAVLTDYETRLKQVFADDHMRPVMAIEDPLLTLSMPPTVTAHTGIDALCHAIESFTAINYKYMAPNVRNVTTYGSFPLTDLFALEAMRLIKEHLPVAVHQGTNVEARYGQMLGALCATLAFASGAGAHLNHTLGYPVEGAGIALSHGESNGIFVLHTMAFNIPACTERFGRIAMALGEQVENLSMEEAAYKSLVAVKKLLKTVGMTRNLKDMGVDKGAFPRFAGDVMKMERLLRNNPRRVTAQEVIGIYEKAYDWDYE